MEYTIIKNVRAGYGYRDSSLCCQNCGHVTTRYIKIVNPDRVTDRLLPIIICPTCLHNFIKEINQSILEEVI